MALHHRNHCHGNQILLMDQYAVCSPNGVMEPGLEDHAGTYFAVGVYWIQNGPDFSGSGAVHGSAYP